MKNNKYFSKIAEKIVPYQWEESLSDEVLRFDTNTVPFPPPNLQRFFKSLGNNCPINEYKDPSYKKLETLIAQYEKVQSDMITVTNSGDEALDILAKTFLDDDDTFLVTPPTYEIFSIQCELNKGRKVEVPLSGKLFNVNTNKIITTTNEQKVKLIFLCNPNNPTGTIISQSDIEKVVRCCSTIVVVDEAYREFYGNSSVTLLKKYDNLVILRSFSKFAGIAGARVGYLIANSFLSSKFHSIRFPMGVSYFSYKLAEWVLENDQQWMNQQIEMIKTERERLSNKLLVMGFYVLPSKANFLLVNIGARVKEIQDKLKKKGILIRDRSSKKYLTGCVRITVRSRKENDVLINALKKIV
ncbi:histidinol-phosphate transaminase [Candidatus Roizmanbacteria bacterium RIFCSPHIGHO2_02_FULL_37_13b]|uniref:Histidinol-phosphate transaminase n=1 Tax=Candidatus Roizmanbacteria bacterium RIFCSPLOWO2_02_FULL_36_11 TaxID=1802071 RepID=A0A1F7JCD4_9BACT|nr:MAG: histidinol-phosphate transaminase [Candidatus Roizmanbacteria bacterium RIFCSPHIGHO2_02_FULL_37_13b]OGK53278.1 MAG: histidinol-phosphate transaminase [Candidatus Roizmanbacteria bacterium RIFCSPLOWO2_02_FULL_36_11]